MHPIVSVILFLLGFYLFYATSERADVPASIIKTWAGRWRVLFRWTFVVLMLSSFYAFMQYYGFGAGFFLALPVLLTIASLTVLLIPLRKIIK